MKRIGIITGSGPEAGLDLWKKVLAANRQLLMGRYTGDLDAPEVTIRSVPELGLSMDMESYREELRRRMINTAREVSQFADIYAIACNTLYAFTRDLQGASDTGILVDVTDACRHQLNALNVSSAALLGSRQTMSLGAESAYRNLSNHFDIELPSDHESIHALIHEVKQQGGAQDKLLTARFEEILSKLHSSTIILACTELPLITNVQTGKHLIDVNAALAAEVVSRAHQMQ